MHSTGAKMRDVKKKWEEEMKIERDRRRKECDRRNRGRDAA